MTTSSIGCLVTEEPHVVVHKTHQLDLLLDLADRHLLVGMRGFEDAAFTTAIDVAFEDDASRVVGREDFIAMKVFACGLQDIADAANTREAAAG